MALKLMLLTHVLHPSKNGSKHVDFKWEVSRSHSNILLTQVPNHFHSKLVNTFTGRVSKM
jgi:hypothetical protein